MGLRALSIALAASVLLAGCLESGTGPGGEPPGGDAPAIDETLRTVARGSNPEAEPGVEVFEDEASWDAWWESVKPYCPDDADCPGREAVDFPEERIVAVVSDGGDACYDMHVANATTDVATGVTTVTVEEARPPPETACAKLFWRPYHAVAIPDRDTHVEFEWRNVTTEGGFGDAPSGDGSALTYRTIEKGEYSGVEERRFAVIESEAEWEALWAEHYSNREPVPDSPEVDFSQERVLAVFMGEQRSGGYAIEILGVERADGRVEATVQPSSPGPGEGTTDALTQPHHIVAIPAGEEPVEFIELSEPDRPVSSESTGDESSFREIDRGYSSGVTEKRYLVIESADEWEALWAEHASNRVPAPEAPGIDFGSERIIAVFMGEQRSGGYGIAVTNASLEAGGKLVVDVHLFGPKPDMAVTGALTQPYHIVAMPAMKEQVEFRETRENVE